MLILKVNCYTMGHGSTQCELFIQNARTRQHKEFRALQTSVDPELHVRRLCPARAHVEKCIVPH